MDIVGRTKNNNYYFIVMTSQHQMTVAPPSPAPPPAERRLIPKSMSWLLLILILVISNIWYSSKDLLPIIAELTGREDNNSSSVSAAANHSVVINPKGKELMQQPGVAVNNSSTPAEAEAEEKFITSAANSTMKFLDFVFGANNTIISREKRWEAARSQRNSFNVMKKRSSHVTQSSSKKEKKTKEKLKELLHNDKDLAPMLKLTESLVNEALSASGSNNVANKVEAEAACTFCEGDGRIFNPSIRLQSGLTCADIRLKAETEVDKYACKAFQELENLCCPTGNWRHFWGKNNPECFHVNNICRAPNGGEWFYDRSVLHSSQDTKFNQQPTIAYNRKSHHSNVIPDFRIQFNVSSATIYSGNMTECPYSPTPHHVVTQSAYNHMIGEFYVRQLIGLNLCMRDYPPETDRDIQMYMHIAAKNSSLFDGHRLFMGGLTQNDNELDNFLSLVQGKESCECYQTLAFCGYKRTSTKSTNKTSKSYTFDLEGSISYKQADESKWCHDKKNKRIENLERSYKFERCTTYNDLRQDMLARYAKKDPFLPQKIREYRRQTLSLAGVSLEEVNDVDEWKIVGLAKRQLRRVWLNIDDSVKACDEFRFQKVVCITVNVEEAASPEEQLLMHSSLDALVGIHGAQLTQGIFLPTQGYILELLPWIPDRSWWGSWVARTSSPTPLGVIFHNTELNHLGYALDRDSVPLCKHIVNKTKEIECFRAKQEHNKTFMWDRRNFEVGVDVVTKFVSSFLLQNNAKCDSMKTRAVGNEFVLYNAYCSRGIENKFSTEHYYRKANESGFQLD